MVEAMDRSADPCHDFYQFACGGWMRKNPLPDGRSRWSTFNSIWEQNQALLKHLLGETGGETFSLFDRVFYSMTYIAEFVCLCVAVLWVRRVMVGEAEEEGSV